MTNTVIDTMELINNKAINDHNGKEVSLAGICILKNGKYGAILDTEKPFSINEVYSENNKAHVSTKAISGVVMSLDDIATEEGIAEFNKNVVLESCQVAKICFINLINA